METTLAAPGARHDLQGLVAAIVSARGEDALGNNAIATGQWDLLAAYLQPVMLAQSEVLFEQGASDRTLYLVETGSLSVHFEDEKGRLRLAIVGSGSVLGEGAFFSHQPRSATVQAGSACKLWMLTPVRFAELSQRQPAAALSLAMAIGGVLAKRLGNRRRRVAAT